MEQKLQNALETGEALLWSGSPERFELLDTTHKSAYYKKWLSVVLFCIAAMIGYVIAANHYQVPIHPGVPGMLAFVLVYGLLSDRLDAYKLKNKTVYALTDRRIMILMGMTMKSVQYKDVTEFTFDTDADGHTSLLCGPLPKTEKQNQRRSGTIRGITIDPATGLCDSVVLYAIPEMNQVREILNTRIR